MSAELVTGRVTFLEVQERDRPANKWNMQRHAYRVTLKCEGRTMRTGYYTGTGIPIGSVTIADVLESLCSDASIAINDEFDDLELDRATERAVIAQTDKLRYLLGDHFDSIVFAERD